MRKLLTLSLILLTLTLTACGFHLRGQMELPSQLKYLDLDTEQLTPEWQKNLRLEFQQASVTLQPSSNLKLIVATPKEIRRVASYNERAKASEYELSMSMQYELYDKEKQETVTKSSVKASRIYQYDETNVAGKSVEEGLIKKELRAELIRQLLRQLQWAELS